MKDRVIWDGDPYRIAEWVDGQGCRHLQLEMWRDVPSAVHMTRTSMHTNKAAAAYVAWVSATGVMVREILRRESIEPLAGDRPLSGTARIELAPAVHHRHLDGGRVAEVKTHPYRERDLKNLLWALEDAVKGVLFGDDKWVDEWFSSKHEAEESRFIVELSEVGNA